MSTFTNFATLHAPNLFKMATLPRVSDTSPPPPTKPNRLLETGMYCIRAECRKFDKGGGVVGSYVGYNTSYSVVSVTEEVCLAHKKNGEVCQKEATVTFLYRYPLKLCDGLYFEFDDGKRPIKIL